MPQPTNITQSWQTMELSLASHPTISDDYTLTSFVVRKCNSGNKIILIDNFTLWYDEYSANRQEQEAPAAPTVQSATGTSVTLTPIADNCQYSKDGTTWQSSNVFTGLTTNTEYTFYARYRETVDLFASPASAGTTYTTPVTYKWDLYSTNFTLSDNTTTANFNTAHASEGTYFEGTGLTAGTHATLTSKLSVPAGVYSPKLYARVYNGRAPINVEINGTQVATSLSTSSGGTGNVTTNKYFTLEQFTVTETAPIVMTITATGSGSLFLNSLEIVKVADYVVPVEDQYMGIIGETREAAQLRIGNVNGIRFITEVDTDLVAQAEAEGYTVTMGTLIAPISFGELIEEKTDALNIPTTGYYRNIDGVIAGSIVNIKNSNIDKEFIARGYVTIKNDDVTVTFYSTQQHTGRSLKTLASAAMADEFYEHLNGVQQNLVSSWAYYGE